jgi:hypothetical protein
MAADVRSNISLWSSTESSNLPIGSTTVGANLDDNLRMIQAVTRTQFEDVQWLNYGDVPTFVSTTSFTVPGNQTARYHVNRRVKLFGTTMGTLYGTITSTVFGSVTTVTLALDSGVLTANLSTVSPAALTATNNSLPPSTLTAAQVASSATGGVAATNVQAAITELDTEKANIASPALTGTPTAPTAAQGTNTTQIASTAYAQTELALKANIASPTFTGVPAAPTATGGTNTTQLATTAFVQSAITGGTGSFATVAQVQDGSTVNGGTAGGTANALTITLAPALTVYATGDDFTFVAASANTAAATVAVNGLAVKNITKHGTTALVAGDIVAGKVHQIRYDGTQFQLLNPGNLTFTATQITSTATGDVAATNVQAAIAELATEKATFASPALTGTPTAPTATSGTNTTQLSTTAYVMAQSALDVANTALVHIAGAETITGVKTLTGSPTIQNTFPAINFKDNDLANNAGGLWQLAIANAAVQFIKNTAVAGDFSTFIIPFSLDAAGAATFTSTAIFNGTVTAANATASTHLVTKVQLDGKTFGLRVDNPSGTATIATGPSGWTINRAGAGLIDLTHNLGTTAYALSITVLSGTLCTSYTSLTSTSVRLQVTTTGGTFTDSSFSVVLSVN